MSPNGIIITVNKNENTMQTVIINSGNSFIDISSLVSNFLIDFLRFAIIRIGFFRINKFIFYFSFPNFPCFYIYDLYTYDTAVYLFA